MDDVLRAPAERRNGAFCELVHELVGHEVAEEAVVYPALRQDAPGGDREADARIEEQSAAEHRLAQLERLDPASPEFADGARRLRTAVLAHARAEEEHVLPMLAEAERPAVRAELGSRFDRAKASAPTHPHPHLPGTPPWNQLLGPIAALVDRARDAVAALAAEDRAIAPDGPAADRPSPRPPASRQGPTRQDLYEEARRRKIPGRSKMTKGELQRALGER